MWEGHSDREPSSDDGQDLDSRLESDDPLKLGCLQTGLQELLVGSGTDSRMPVSGVGVSGSRNDEEDGQLAALQAISLLVTRLLRSAQEGRLVEERAPSEGKMSLVSAVLPVCFSCGRQGHGVNQCSRVDTFFHFCHRGGRWMSGMANIGPHGLMELD